MAAPYCAHAAPETNSPEIQLVKTIQAQEDNHLDIALNKVDALLSTQPDFRLAQLVKGDLLMAHAGTVNDFGSLANAPREKIADLRAEARARLLRVQSPATSKHLAPKFLWQLDAKQKYVLVVDASRSTLFVYENVNGEPRYVTDFHTTIGKLGTDKFVEGDQRTPIGVYFITAELFKDKLADLYGNGTFPLNYPNELDKRTGRGGSGIWLHGTPSNTYSRPPQASNGFVALSNEDLDKLTPYLQVGITPVIITKQMDELTAQDQKERDSLLHAIDQWRNDWASLNADRYLSHYAKDFSSRKADYAAWVRHKKRVNAKKSWITLDLSNISVFNYPDQPNVVVVTFDQDYNSSNLSNRMKKRQYWVKQGNQWKIVYDGAA
jgi:murein L,D-transpeptidase YafK